MLRSVFRGGCGWKKEGIVDWEVVTGGVSVWFIIVNGRS